MANYEIYREFMARADHGYGLLLLTIAVAMGTCALLYQPLLALTNCAVSKVSMFPLAAIIALGIVMRIPKLFEYAWYDETFSARMASIPLANLPNALMGDVHPPLHYFLQWLSVSALGMSGFSIRLPALIAGIVLILLIHRLALGLGFTRGSALITALVVALLPATIYYSTEARQYSLLSCLGVGMFISILEGRRGWFFVAGTLMPFTHNIGYVYLGVMGLAALAYHGKRWALPVVAAGVFSAVWLPFMVQQSLDVSDGFWLPPLTPAGAFRPVTDMTISIKLPEEMVIAAYVPAIGLALFSLYAARRWFLTRQGLLFLAFTFGVPVGLALVAIFWSPVYLSRALLPCVLCLVVLWSNAAMYYPSARVMLAAGLIAGLLGFYQSERLKPEIPAYLQSCRSADSIFNLSTAGAFMTAYYVPEMPQYLWTESNDLNQTLTSSSKLALGFKQRPDISGLHGRVCVLQVSNNLSSLAQHEYAQSLLERYPHESATLTVNLLYNLHLHILEVDHASPTDLSGM